jgi:4-amino-4-deoxy-L-arabinose transferase-like glycosyltransferase
MLRAADGQFSTVTRETQVRNRVEAAVLPVKMHFPTSGMTANGYILSVLELLRKNARFFLRASLAALGLRLLFVLRLPAVVDDSRLYADIATNWLEHGVYGITNSGQIMPTLSRLPGYPAFLAAAFAIFGKNNFRAVLLIQVLFDLGTCFLIADLARQMFSQRAAKTAFLLAALCPFLANYAAAALTETLEIFFTTLALDLAIRGLENLRNHLDTTPIKASATWLACGLSVGACTLLRPDGGILFAALGVYLFLGFVRSWRTGGEGAAVSAPARGLLPILRAGIILAFGALALLLPWTLRNLHTLHRFQPLAPRYANDADEPVMAGFNRWAKTWIADTTSVQEIYWKVPGDVLDITRLPRRAFDSNAQLRETEQLFADYNQDREVTPELDARFGALAATRIYSAPLRYYVWLPALRVADMWLRPRTELLPSDPRWWEFDDDPVWLSVSIAFGLINLAYVGAAAAGLLRSRALIGIGLFLLFLTMRSLFLGTLENPEPRYTLECYPVVILAAAALFIGKSNREDRKP